MQRLMKAATKAQTSQQAREEVERSVQDVVLPHFGVKSDADTLREVTDVVLVMRAYEQRKGVFRAMAAALSRLGSAERAREPLVWSGSYKRPAYLAELCERIEAATCTRYVDDLCLVFYTDHPPADAPNL